VQVHLQNISAIILYQVHRIKVKVTGTKPGVYTIVTIYTHLMVVRLRLKSYFVFTHFVFLHCESKKAATLTMAITLSVLHRFAKFSLCCKER